MFLQSIDLYQTTRRHTPVKFTAPQITRTFHFNVLSTSLLDIRPEREAA